MLTIAAAVGWLVGLRIGQGLPPLGVAALPLLVSLAGLGALERRRPLARLIAAALALAVLGVLRAQAVAPDPGTIGRWAGVGQIELRGVVAGEPDHTGAGTRMAVTVEEVRALGSGPRAAGATELASGTVLATVPGRAWRYGDRVELVGRLDRPLDRDGAPFGELFARQGVAATMRADEARVLAPPAASDPSATADQLLFGALYGAKDYAAAQLDRRLPAPTAALARGLLLGGTSAMPPDLANDFRRSGLTHVVAVSGYNVSLVAAALVPVSRLAAGPRRRVRPTGAGGRALHARGRRAGVGRARGRDGLPGAAGPPRGSPRGRAGRARAGVAGDDGAGSVAAVRPRLRALLVGDARPDRGVPLGRRPAALAAPGCGARGTRDDPGGRAPDRAAHRGVVRTAGGAVAAGEPPGVADRAAGDGRERARRSDRPAARRHRRARGLAGLGAARLDRRRRRGVRRAGLGVAAAWAAAAAPGLGVLRAGGRAPSRPACALVPGRRAVAGRPRRAASHADTGAARSRGCAAGRARGLGGRVRGAAAGASGVVLRGVGRRARPHRRRPGAAGRPGSERPRHAGRPRPRAALLGDRARRRRVDRRRPARVRRAAGAVAQVQGRAGRGARGGGHAAWRPRGWPRRAGPALARAAPAANDDSAPSPWREAALSAAIPVVSPDQTLDLALDGGTALTLRPLASGYALEIAGAGGRVLLLGDGGATAQHALAELAEGPTDVLWLGRGGTALDSALRDALDPRVALVHVRPTSGPPPAAPRPDERLSVLRSDDRGTVELTLWPTGYEIKTRR